MAVTIMIALWACAGATTINQLCNNNNGPDYKLAVRFYRPEIRLREILKSVRILEADDADVNEQSTSSVQQEADEKGFPNPTHAQDTGGISGGTAPDNKYIEVEHAKAAVRKTCPASEREERDTEGEERLVFSSESVCVCSSDWISVDPPSTPEAACCQESTRRGFQSTTTHGHSRRLWSIGRRQRYHSQDTKLRAADYSAAQVREELKHPTLVQQVIEVASSSTPEAGGREQRVQRSKSQKRIGNDEARKTLYQHDYARMESPEARATQEDVAKVPVPQCRTASSTQDTNQDLALKVVCNDADHTVPLSVLRIFVVSVFELVLLISPAISLRQRRVTLPTLCSVERSEGVDASFSPLKGSNSIVYESAASQPICPIQRSDSVSGPETLATPLSEKLPIVDVVSTCVITLPPSD
jgi:hypothetical protein